MLDESDGFQFLAPRADLFGSGAVDRDAGRAPVADAFGGDDDERSPRRWLTVAGGLGLVGLIAIAVLAASPWSGEEEADRLPVPDPAPPEVVVPPAPAPSTTARAATGQAVPLTPGALSPAAAAEVLEAFLIDPRLLPPTMAPLPAVMPNDAADDLAGGAWLELWGAPGSSRLQGRWFSFGYESGIGYAQASAATRIRLDDGTPAIRWTASDGVSGLTFEMRSTTVTFTWYGLSDDEVLRVAGSVVEPDGTPELGPSTAPRDLLRLVSDRSTSAHPTDAYLYPPSASVTYVDEDGTYLTVSSTDRMAVRAALAPFVIAGGPDAPAASVDVESRSVSIVTIAPGARGRSSAVVAEWVEGDRVVRIHGGPADRLLALVPLVRRGTAGEWWDLAAHGRNRGPVGTVEERSVLIAGDLPDAGQWYAEVFEDRRRAVVRLSPVVFPSTGIVMIDLAAGPCGSVADLRTTTVACVVPADPQVAKGGTMVVRGAPGERVIEMSDPAAGTWSVGIQSYDALGAYEVSVASPSGARLGTLVVPAGGPA